MLFSVVRIFTILIVLFGFIPAAAFAELLPSETSAAVEPARIDLSNMKRVDEMTTAGVLATAYIVAVDPAENRDTTHSVVVTFVNEESGVPLAKALVGIKHRKLFGATSEPVWMKSKADQPELFFAEVNLKKRGTYLFIVGSKLEDDKKRQFTFEYRN